MPRLGVSVGGFPLGSTLALCLLLACGCTSSPPSASDIQFDVVLEPAQPTVGDAKVFVTLTRPDGEPVDRAQVRVEGNMNHAGMKPSFAELREDQPGRYVGLIDFTMGGDWFLLINVVTPEGETAEHKTDVRGVAAQ